MVAKTQSLRLQMQNIGPLEETNVELEEFTVIYGLNGTGKSHIFKALRLLALMNIGVADAYEAIKMLKRTRDTGLIIYNDAVKLIITKDGVSDGQETRKPSERLPLFSSPRIVLYHVKYNAVEIYGLPTMRQPVAYTLEDLLTPSVFVDLLFDIDLLHNKTDGIDVYDEYLNELNKRLNVVTDLEVVYYDRPYFRDGWRLVNGDDVPEGAKRVAIMLAAMMLARYATPNGATPVIYLDHPESGLGVSYLSIIADFFRHDSNAITVAETCSGFLLRIATIRSNTKYYVVADGHVHEKLTLELFKQEVNAMSDVSAL